MTPEDPAQHSVPWAAETDEDASLHEILSRLIDLYHPVAVYLFGSRARGDDGPDSDFDIMVVVSDDMPAEQRRSRLAYDTLWDTGTAADILVLTTRDFEGRRHLAASLPATVLREGKLLYAA